jgi:uridylate kinase
MEIDADIVIKATKVNGVYSADPKKDLNATRFDALSYQQVLANKYEVMDMTAFTLCQEHGMPILVVDFWAENDLYFAVQGNHDVGTIIRG